MSIGKKEVYEILRARGIPFEVTEHGAVWNMEDLAAVPLPYPSADAKNLFLRDEKKRAFFLLTVRGDKRVDLKAFAPRCGVKRLSFASPEDLMARLGLIPGAVSPLGVLNGLAKDVQLFLDRDFLADPGLVGVHPCDNTATVWLRAEDLAALARDSGVPVTLLSF